MENKIVKAALLHDIGKFIMRAKSIKNKTHSKIGEDYLKEKGFDDDILLSVANHHSYDLRTIDKQLQNDSLVYIVYEADNISSALDRRDNINSDETDTEWQSDIALKTIFSSFKQNEGTKSYYYPLRDLNPELNINYPEEKIYASSDKYEKLKDILDKELSKDLSINSLIELLETTMTYIPSSTSTKQNADISLFDHSKTTAAIATCMYRYMRENNNQDFRTKFYTKPERDENFYLLLSGDISGIQDFIYTISSKGALKSLRARSFYLEIMLEHIIDELCEKLCLTRANLLYTGGGHFYMLVPNTTSIKNGINVAEEKINAWFKSQFGTDLYLAMAYEEANSNNLITTKSLFRNLSFKLSKKKQTRYSKQQLKELLTPQELKAERECNICNTSSKETKNHGSNLGETCDICYNLFLAGKSLIQDNVVLTVTNYEEENSLQLPSLDDDGKYLSFKKIETGKRFYVKNQRYTGNNYATNLFVGDYNYKVNKDEPADFSDLVENQQGINRLAAMRCDVDNLGQAFINGYDEKYATISRVTSLSRQLSLFFKFYINKICKGNISGTVENNLTNFYINDTENKEKKLVIVYSGGDDVFVVGSWIDVINFSFDLREAFRKFTCDKLSFSAGIGFFSKDYPISQIAKYTGELEEYAKKYDNEKKDAIALFGVNDKTALNEHTYHWNEFKEEVYSKIELLKRTCYFNEDEKDNNKIMFSTSMMYKFKQLLKGDNQINVARLAYTLARMLPKEAKEETILYNNSKKLKENIYKWAIDDKKTFLTALDLIIYLNRNEG